MKKRIGSAIPRKDGNWIQLSFYLPAGAVDFISYTTRRKEAFCVNGIVIPAYDGKGKINTAGFERARRVLESIQEKILCGKFKYEDFFPASTWPGKMRGKTVDAGTIGADLRTWYAGRENEWKSGKKGYRLAIEFWANEIIDEPKGAKLGDMKTVALSPDHLEAIIKKWKTTDALTMKTICNRKTPLNQMLDEAVIKRRIPVNPFNLLPKTVFNLTKEQKEGAAIKRQKRKAFDIWEVWQLIKYAKPRIKWLVQFAFWSGLRLSELFGLAWEDIDFENGIIRLWLGRTEGVLSTLKTDGSERILYMDELTPAVREALVEQKKQTFMQEAVTTKFGPRRFVFLTLHRKPMMRYNQLARSWKTLLKRAKVFYLPAKHTRHTFASLMIAAGEPKDWIRGVMGHEADSDMLENNYAQELEQAAKVAGRDNGAKGRALYAAVQLQQGKQNATG